MCFEETGYDPGSVVGRSPTIHFDPEAIRLAAILAPTEFVGLGLIGWKKLRLAVFRPAAFGREHAAKPVNHIAVTPIDDVSV